MAMSELQLAARAEADAILAKDKTAFAMRSCWHCNGAHDHLKEVDYIFRCFACGHTFYKGVQICCDSEDYSDMMDGA